MRATRAGGRLTHTRKPALKHILARALKALAPRTAGVFRDAAHYERYRDVCEAIEALEAARVARKAAA